MKQLLLALALLFGVLLGAVPASAVDCPLNTDVAYKAKTNNSVWYVTSDCKKKAFRNAHMFKTYFRSWDSVQEVEAATLRSIPNDSISWMAQGPLYDPQFGAVVKTLDDAKVYFLLGGKKFWIDSEASFLELGYKWEWVEDVDPRLLDKYETGEELSSEDGHRAHMLVKRKGDSKVYRLEEDDDGEGLVYRHVADEETFKELGYRFDRVIEIDERSAKPNPFAHAENREGTEIRIRVEEERGGENMQRRIELRVKDKTTGEEIEVHDESKKEQEEDENEDLSAADREKLATIFIGDIGHLGDYPNIGTGFARVDGAYVSKNVLLSPQDGQDADFIGITIYRIPSMSALPNALNVGVAVDQMRAFVAETDLVQPTVAWTQGVYEKYQYSIANNMKNEDREALKLRPLKKYYDQLYAHLFQYVDGRAVLGEDINQLNKHLGLVYEIPYVLDGKHHRDFYIQKNGALYLFHFTAEREVDRVKAYRILNEVTFTS